MTRQRGNPAQEELWSKAELQPTVADGCLLRCATDFLDAIEDYPRDRALPREMDELSFASLLICAEHGAKLSRNPSALLTKCRDAACDRGFTGTYDLYPWALAIEAVSGKINRESIMIGRLVRNMAHGDSGVRGFMFELGWFVRKWLPRDQVAPLLLTNVADTLGGWWLSLGLCSVLFETRDEFWAYADALVLEDDRFESQYRDRLQQVRESGLGMCLCGLYQLDSRVRTVIDGYALGMRCHE